MNVTNKLKNKKYHTVGTVPKSNIKIIERGKIDIQCNLCNPTPEFSDIN
jgi:hypothetical protein